MMTDCVPGRKAKSDGCLRVNTYVADDDGFWSNGKGDKQ